MDFIDIPRTGEGSTCQKALVHYHIAGILLLFLKRQSGPCMGCGRRYVPTTPNSDNRVAHSGNVGGNLQDTQFRNRTDTVCQERDMSLPSSRYKTKIEQQEREVGRRVR